MKNTNTTRETMTRKQASLLRDITKAYDLKQCVDYSIKTTSFDHSGLFSGAENQVVILVVSRQWYSTGRVDSTTITIGPRGKLTQTQIGMRI